MVEKTRAQLRAEKASLENNEPKEPTIEGEFLGKQETLEIPEQPQKETRAKTGTRKPREKKYSGPEYKINKTELAGWLMMGHKFAASTLDAPILDIEKDEAEQLAGALADVARHYNLGLSQKQMDWLKLIGTSAAIYGARAFAFLKAQELARQQAAAEYQRQTAALNPDNIILQ